jgi:hypothetical protein
MENDRFRVEADTDAEKSVVDEAEEKMAAQKYAHTTLRPINEQPTTRKSPWLKRQSVMDDISEPQG